MSSIRQTTRSKFASSKHPADPGEGEEREGEESSGGSFDGSTIGTFNTKERAVLDRLNAVKHPSLAGDRSINSSYRKRDEDGAKSHGVRAGQDAMSSAERLRETKEKQRKGLESAGLSKLTKGI